MIILADFYKTMIIFLIGDELKHNNLDAKRFLVSSLFTLLSVSKEKCKNKKLFKMQHCVKAVKTGIHRTDKVWCNHIFLEMMKEEENGPPCLAYHLLVLLLFIFNVIRTNFKTERCAFSFM